jgi:hypothetical protein
VTLHYAVNPGGGRDPIGNTATVVDGVATFSELAIDTPGIGYRFWAISGKLIGPASDLFDIGDSVTPCHPGALCDSGPLTAPANDAQVRAVADRATTTRALTAFFGGTELSCGSGRSIANVNVQDRSKTITFAVLGQNRDYRTKAPRQRLCFGAPTRFPTVDAKGEPNGLSRFNPATGEFEGLLPDCAPKATSATVSDPCVASRCIVSDDTSARPTRDSDLRKRHDDVVVTVFAPAGDPRMTT